MPSRRLPDWMILPLPTILLESRPLPSLLFDLSELYGYPRLASIALEFEF